MTDLPPLGSEKADLAAQRVLGHFDAPAFVRRARQMEHTIEQLLESCRQKQGEWLEMVRLRLGVLRGLAGQWANLTPLLTDAAQVEVLEQLQAELQPRLRLPVETTSSPRRLRSALNELRHSVGRFNRRWAAFLASVDLSRVNKLIDGYNRYYVLEKECVVRSAPVARLGFRPKEHITLDWLTAALPPLGVPKLKS